MTEQHECKWRARLKGWLVDGFYCSHPDCYRRLMWNDVESHLNEYETLKKATDALNAEMVIRNIIIYGEGGFLTDQFLKSLRAYANILSGENNGRD